MKILDRNYRLFGVINPIDAVAQPWLRWIVRLSPATPFTLAWQRTLFEGRFP